MLMSLLWSTVWIIFQQWLVRLGEKPPFLFLICTSGDSHTTFTSNSLPKLHLYLFLYFHLYLYIYFHLYLYLYFHLYLYLIKIQYTVEWSAGLGFLSISSPMYWQLDSADHENQMKIIIRYYHIMIIRWWLW